jgi:hypothetical protein
MVVPFELFSARKKPAKENLPYKSDCVPQKFRVQAWYILEKAFGAAYREGDAYHPATLSYLCWKVVRDILREELGVFYLSEKIQPYAVPGPKDECFHFFINKASASRSLDFLDLAFRVVDRFVRNKPRHVLEEADISATPDEAISQFNTRLDQHHLGYQFTGGELMRHDSQFVHAEITETVAQLLTSAGFEGPNQEFLSAHKAYLKGNMKEAIREALNALESTMKVICTQRKWKFDPKKDTSSKLLSIIFEKGLVPDYLQSEFTALRATLEASVPRVRNRAAEHGQGAEPVEVPKYLAAYALHMTASGIVFLVEANTGTCESSISDSARSSAGAIRRNHTGARSLAPDLR